MIPFKKIPFLAGDEKYEIRVMHGDHTINVVAFRNNRPANGFRYQIKFPKKCNAISILEKGAAKDLVEIAKNDITLKKWERVIDYTQRT